MEGKYDTVRGHIA